MNLIQIFLGANLVELLMRMVFLLLGSIFMYILFPLFGSATRILYCRERDGRGTDLAVKLEDEVRLDTANNVRFFKHGRSYAFTGMMNRLKSVFFAKEGTAYTAKLEGFSGHPRSYEAAAKLVMATEAAKEALVVAAEAGPIQIDIEFPTVWEAVKFKLGDDFLRPFPEDKKKLLQDDKFLVTVDLEPGLTPEGYKPATEQDIADKGKRDMAKLLGESAKMALHGGMIDKVPWIGMGIAVGLVGAMALGWIPVGTV